MHRRRYAFLVSFLTFTALLTTSCNLATAPVPADLEAAPSSVPVATTDGVHFLEPIQQAVDADGVFDPTAPLTIEFFRVQDGSAVGGPLGPTLSTADGTVRVSVDDETGAYLGVWALRDSAIKAGDVVRAEVRTSNAAAGAAACDGGVDLDGTGCLAYFTAAIYRDARQANRATAPEGMLRVVANQTLPIRLFVAEGAANLAPAVEILAPDDGALFPTGATVTLSGAALDPEEGDLSSAIEWHSDVDGPLGTGPSVSVPLSDDTHTITASVRDRYGRSGSTTIAIAVGIEELSAVTDAGGAFVVFTNGSLVSLAPGFVPAGTPVKVTSAPVPENVFREGVEAVGDQITVSVPSSVLSGTALASRATSLRPADFTLNEDCDTANDCLFVNFSLDRTLAEAAIIGEVTFQVVRDVGGATKEILGSQALLFPALVTPGDAARYGLRVSKALTDRIHQAIFELEQIPPDVRNELQIVFVPASIRTKDRTASGVVEGLYRIDDSFAVTDLGAACSQPAQHQIPSSVAEVVTPTFDTRRPLVLVHGWTQIQDYVDLIGYGLDRTSNLEVIRDMVRNNPIRNPYFPFATSSEWLTPPLAPTRLPQLCAWNEFLRSYFGDDGAALRETYELYSFGYDSRQSIGSNAMQFAAALDVAFAGRQDPAVVAHSTGGLLTHAAMLNGTEVERLITLGSPLLGALSVTCSSTGAVPPGEPSEFYGAGMRCTNATVNPQVMDVLPEAMSESLGSGWDAFLGISDEVVALLAGPMINVIQSSAFNDDGTQDLTWFEAIEYEVTELVGHTCADSPLTSSTPGCGPLYVTRTRSTGTANPFTQGLLTESEGGAFEPDRIVAFMGDRLPTKEPRQQGGFPKWLMTVAYDAIAATFESLPTPVDSDGFITTDSAGFQPGAGRPEIPATNRRLRDGFTHSQLAGFENFVAIRDELLDVIVDVPLVGVVPGAFSLTGGQFTLTVSPRDAANGFVAGNFDVGDFSFENIGARQVSSGLSAPGTAIPTKVTTIAPGISEDATLVLSFDASGSMTSNDPARLRVVAGKALVDLLGPEDEAAIIEFSSATRVLQTFTADKLLLKSAIDRVTQSGGTSMYSSLLSALTMLDQRAGPNPAIVILTDGQSGDSSRYATVVAQAQSQQTPIFTIGLGSRVNAGELQSLARETNGTYAAASDATGLAAVFDAIGVGVTQGRILVDGEGTFSVSLPGPGGYVVSGELLTDIGGSTLRTPFEFFVTIQ